MFMSARKSFADTSDALPPLRFEAAEAAQILPWSRAHFYGPIQDGSINHQKDLTGKGKLTRLRRPTLTLRERCKLANLSERRPVSLGRPAALPRFLVKIQCQFAPQGLHAGPLTLDSDAPRFSHQSL
jgi:hypothetical protein